MKILYVILTADKYHDRRELQCRNWMKYICCNDDYIYLCDSARVFFNFIWDEKMVGYDLPTGYDNVALKYSSFIKQYNLFDNFDWIFFCDDDTFLFPKKLHHLLRYFNKDEPIMIGRTGVYEGWQVCSGGAGFAVSQNLILKVQQYLKTNPYEHLPNSDTSLGMWAKLAEPNMKVIDRIEQFQTQHLRHEDNGLVDIDSCITFHYCTEYDYKILSKYLKYAV